MAHTGQRPERVGNSLVQVYERGGKSVNSGCKRLKSWLTDAYWAVKRTRKLPWLSDLLILQRQYNRRLVCKRARGRTTGQGLPVRVISLLSLPPPRGRAICQQTNKQKKAIQFSKSLHSWIYLNVLHFRMLVQKLLHFCGVNILSSTNY